MLTSRLMYASSHIDKIFVNKHAHRMLSSSILCVVTSTDNIIDAVVTCLSVNKSTPLNKISRSAPAKQLSILQCLFIGINIVVIAKKI